MRWHIGLEPEFKWRAGFGRLDFWLGTTERAVAVTLVWLVPSHQLFTALSSFIGGWVALKFAANWKRLNDNDDQARKGSLLSFIGNVLSFGFAIIPALLLLK